MSRSSTQCSSPSPLAQPSRATTHAMHATLGHSPGQEWGSVRGSVVGLGRWTKSAGGLLLLARGLRGPELPLGSRGSFPFQHRSVCCQCMCMGRAALRHCCPVDGGAAPSVAQRPVPDRCTRNARTSVPRVTTPTQRQGDHVRLTTLKAATSPAEHHHRPLHGRQRAPTRGDPWKAPAPRTPPLAPTWTATPAALSSASSDCRTASGRGVSGTQRTLGRVESSNFV